MFALFFAMVSSSLMLLIPLVLASHNAAVPGETSVTSFVLGDVEFELEDSLDSSWIQAAFVLGFETVMSFWLWHRRAISQP